METTDSKMIQKVKRLTLTKRKEVTKMRTVVLKIMEKTEWKKIRMSQSEYESRVDTIGSSLETNKTINLPKFNN